MFSITTCLSASIPTFHFRTLLSFQVSLCTLFNYPGASIFPFIQLNLFVFFPPPQVVVLYPPLFLCLALLTQNLISRSYNLIFYAVPPFISSFTGDKIPSPGSFVSFPVSGSFHLCFSYIFALDTFLVALGFADARTNFSPGGNAGREELTLIYCKLPPELSILVHRQLRFTESLEDADYSETEPPTRSCNSSGILKKV